MYTVYVYTQVLCTVSKKLFEHVVKILETADVHVVKIYMVFTFLVQHAHPLFQGSQLVQSLDRV